MVDLAGYRKSYVCDRPIWVQAIWFIAGLPLLRCSMLPLSSVRRLLLRLFGAHIGHGVIIKPGVRVKYPWLLSVGDYSWLGEDCWLDNLAQITVGNNVSISQGAYLCTGNHDWSDVHFGLITRAITIGNGAWVGAGAIVTPGVTLGDCAVVTAGSVVNKDVPSFHIYAGNPAQFVRTRNIRTDTVDMDGVV
jgi:putative colanic acid biosynthesis acetyltransferase WcaF